MAPETRNPDQEPAADADTDDAAGDAKATDWEAEARKWKALARKHEGEAKKNAGAAQRLTEAEDADKSEVQRANDKAAAAEARAKAAETRADRAEVAAAKGLSASLASRLVGETREELEADADELLKVMKPASDGKAPDTGTRSRPREDLRSGAAPQAEPEDNDPTKLAALIPRG